MLLLKGGLDPTKDLKNVKLVYQVMLIPLASVIGHIKLGLMHCQRRSAWHAMLWCDTVLGCLDGF